MNQKLELNNCSSRTFNYYIEMYFIKKRTTDVDALINWLNSHKVKQGTVNDAFLKSAEDGNLEVLKLLSELVAPQMNMNHAIRYAAKNGHLEIVKFLISLPSVDPSDLENHAIRAAAVNGHLEVVKLLSSLPSVDPTQCDNDALRMSYSHPEVQNYLASLPCYNTFAANITTDKKIQRIEVLTNFNLEHHIDLHRINSRKNLSFLFFNDPDSAFSSLPRDIKQGIIEQNNAIDNFNLSG